MKPTHVYFFSQNLKATWELLAELFVTTKAQGTGLGLAVVKAVARAHQGNFNLQSTQGQGTCASLFMPFASLENIGNL